MKPKNLVLLIIACNIYIFAFAQPTIKHQRTIGGSDDDQCYSICLTKDGGLIAGGYSMSDKSYEKTENSRGNYDYWVVKLDSLGHIERDKTIGGNDIDLLASMKQCFDGGYILGGSSYSNSSGEKTENNRDQLFYTKDYWIVKLDSSGHIEWDRTIGGANDDNLSSLQQTRDGGFILGGYSKSEKSGEKTENNCYAPDFWVVKLNKNGNIEWDKTIGAGASDFLSELQQTSDGGYILGGSSNSNAGCKKTENSRGGAGKVDYWVVKLDSTGNIEWDKTIGGGNDDYLSSIKLTSDGGYILAGTSKSNKSFEKSENNRGGGGYYDPDYWIVKLDNAHNIEWDKTIGGSSGDQLTSVELTAEGGYIVGGYSASNISGEKSENNWGIYNDYWVVKINSWGRKQWDKTIGGTSDDVLQNIREVEKNRYALGGYSMSQISGDKTQANRGPDYTRDFWLAELKYKRPDSIAVTSLLNTNNIKLSECNRPFSIYPNPAKDILHIQIKNKAIFTLTDQSGKIILTKTLNNNGEINVRNLSAGLYYLKNNETGAVQKVMIVK